MRTGVLLIRPHDQANHLEQALAEQGMRVFRQAVIETQSVTLSDNDWQRLAQTFDGVVVVSPAAATYFDEQLKAKQQSWPAAAYYCVGSGTAERLVPLCGQAATYPAPQHTAEALLQLHPLQQLDNQRWLLITGGGGRPLIADTLRERGAELDILEVYQRQPLHPDLHGPLSDWTEQVQVIVVTSEQQITLFFEGLKDIPGATQWLEQCDWVVSSERLQSILAGHDIAKSNIHIAQNATHEALLHTIKQLEPSQSAATQAETSTKQPGASNEQDKSAAIPERSTPDEQPSTPPQAEKKTMTSSSKRSPFTTFLTFILLLCVLILGAGGYWVWAQQEDFRQQTNAQFAELNQRIEQSNRSQQALEGNVMESLESQLNQRLSQLQEERSRQARQDREAADEERQAMREAFEQQTADLERLKSEVDTANLRVSEDLYLVEARDLVLAAGRKLWLDYDRRSAIQLLERAERLLADANRSHLLPIRQQLRNDIELLEGTEDQDLDALAMRISTQRRQIRNLPLLEQEYGVDGEPVDEEISSDFSEWRANLSKAWASFTDDFIRIQRTDELPALQIGQEQRSLLISQLELQLQLAQQALMQRQTVSYRESLLQSAEWIDAYFDTDNQAVQRTLQELEALSEYDLDPSYPTRLLSEAMLRDAVDELLQGAN
ncbi:MAG: uroporphyrinogen-III synthase [Idiomarina sp.]|nr:uroporphyrinogen-III synthase [Idiomarina sp.]